MGQFSELNSFILSSMTRKNRQLPLTKTGYDRKIMEWEEKKKKEKKIKQ